MDHDTGVRFALSPLRPWSSDSLGTRSKRERERERVCGRRGYGDHAQLAALLARGARLSVILTCVDLSIT